MRLINLRNFSSRKRGMCSDSECSDSEMKAALQASCTEKNEDRPGGREKQQNETVNLEEIHVLPG